jgi:hypothetical protein
MTVIRSNFNSNDFLGVVRATRRRNAFSCRCCSAATTTAGEMQRRGEWKIEMDDCQVLPRGVDL